MDENQILGIVERYVRKQNEPGQITVTRIADHKTVYIEQLVGDTGGRAITMTEYKVDGVRYWAGYSWRSQTIYVSAS